MILAPRGVPPIRASFLNIFDEKKVSKSKNIYEFGDEFYPGRPFLITVFQERTTMKYIIFVNVHCGHDKNNQIEDNPEFKDLIKETSNTYPNSETIIAGDFNQKYDKESNMYKILKKNHFYPVNHVGFRNIYSIYVNITQFIKMLNYQE